MEWIPTEFRLPRRSSPFETERVLGWIDIPHSTKPYCPYMVVYATTENKYPIVIKEWHNAATDQALECVVSAWQPLPPPKGLNNTKVEK